MLEGQFTRLRTVDMADAEWMREASDISRRDARFQYRFPITELQQQDFIRELSGKRDQFYFVAEPPGGGQPFGVCSIHEVDYRNQRAECGIFWDAEASGGEIAAFEAGFLIRHYAYSYLNVQKMTAEVLADNQRAIRFNEAIGMQLEGTRQRHVYYDGKFHDLLLYAQFRDDFYNRPTPVIQNFLATRRSE